MGRIMITKINMKKVNCYKNPASLTTDKKINLIYGLNGTGKSTLSNYLYDRTYPNFVDCSIEGLTDDEILVYNQHFIRDYFYQSESLKGIFTLSKENKEAEEKAILAQLEIVRKDKDKTTKSTAITSTTNDLDTKRENAETKTWEIKKKFAGDDRILEYCLDNLKGKRETLYNYLASVVKTEHEPTKTIDQLKKEVDAIQGNTANKYDLLPKINIDNRQIESTLIFSKSIIGNENSTVAELIKKLKNSDWIKEGIKFISQDTDDIKQLCPFCQERTITATLIENIKNYFDEVYENDINELKTALSAYDANNQAIPKKEVYDTNLFIKANKSNFENLYNAVVYCLSDNKEKIAEKIKTPSQLIVLKNSSQVINDFNGLVDEINILITEHNAKIQNREATLITIKQQFWTCMRWKYDQTISAFQNDKTIIEKKLKNLKDEIIKIDDDITAQKLIIIDQQKKTINIDEAIANINDGLIELGIDGFHIEKHKDVLYKIVRTEQCENTFETLSEGEKMIISFLYFRELCKGKRSASSVASKKIVVIDDPISSLSHIYIFNIGLMIKNDFFNSPQYEQVFLLTHSLYFFYEMTNPNYVKRKDDQKLFRLSKNIDGSQIIEMKYEEIQNDYHSYWFIIKDDKQPPALTANCMRNIIEYFFNFIEKRDLNNVFQKPELKAIQYQAFYRYINRESHSLGQNIFDIKEFNYSDFKEAFRLVFMSSGYEEHYKKMMK